MVVAEETSLSSVPYCVQNEEEEVHKPPRLAYDELQRLIKIVRMKGLNVSESQLMVAVYTGCDLFFNEGVVDGEEQGC